jgi:hypothetical protein
MNGKLTWILALSLAQSIAGASQAGPSHITIMPMANMSRPDDLDFQGGSCEIDAAGASMTCAFQQVLLTLAPNDPTTCLITTNRYQQTFKKQDARRWVSTEGPDACGVVAETTLQQDEKSLAVYWRVAMNTRKTLANKGRDVSSSCGSVDDAPETLASTDAGRPLSCKSVKASSLEF